MLYSQRKARLCSHCAAANVTTSTFLTGPSALDDCVSMHTSVRMFVGHTMGACRGPHLRFAALV